MDWISKDVMLDKKSKMVSIDEQCMGLDYERGKSRRRIVNW